MFPSPQKLSGTLLPSENMCCVSLRIQYGAFRYYSGGDLTCDTEYGRLPWRDIETPVANSAGPVSVAVANHHGYFDACGPAMVRALRPRVWVLPDMARFASGNERDGQHLQRGTLPGRSLGVCRWYDAGGVADDREILEQPLEQRRPRGNPCAPEWTRVHGTRHGCARRAWNLIKSFGPFAA